eukprot:2962913-Amphidinium_carterae.1
MIFAAAFIGRVQQPTQARVGWQLRLAVEPSDMILALTDASCRLRGCGCDAATAEGCRRTC